MISHTVPCFLCCETVLHLVYLSTMGYHLLKAIHKQCRGPDQKSRNITSKLSNLYILQQYFYTFRMRQCIKELTYNHHSSPVLYIVMRQCPVTQQSITHWSIWWSGRGWGCTSNEWDHPMRENGWDEMFAQFRDWEDRWKEENKTVSYRLNDAWFPGYLGSPWGTHAVVVAWRRKFEKIQREQNESEGRKHKLKELK